MSLYLADDRDLEMVRVALGEEIPNVGRWNPNEQTSNPN